MERPIEKYGWHKYINDRYERFESGAGGIITIYKYSNVIEFDDFDEQDLSFEELQAIYETAKQIKEENTELHRNREEKVEEELKRYEEKFREDKKVELTEQAYKDILARLDKLERSVKDLDFDDSEYCHMSYKLRKRVEKLENKILDDIQSSGYSYGSIGTKTADEMFEELGYDVYLQKTDIIKYKSSTSPFLEIILNKNPKGKWEYKKYDYDLKWHVGFSAFITEDECKSIHKKIEEMKHA